MKAILQSTSININGFPNEFHPATYSYEFVCPHNNKWFQSLIRVSFEDMGGPLFPNMQDDDEFEIEVILKRIPKSQPETKTFK